MKGVVGPGDGRALLLDALRVLGIERLSCAVHDRCLPADEVGDAGCGAPGGDGAQGFLQHLADLGFTAVQLGPPGQVSPVNLSPYDGTLFSRSPLQLSWSNAAGDGLVDPAWLSSLPDSAGPSPASSAGFTRCDYPRAFTEAARRWNRLHARWEDGTPSPQLRARLEDFVAHHRAWLTSDGLHRVLSELHQETNPRTWPAEDARPTRQRLEILEDTYRVRLSRFDREQWLLHEQHQVFRSRAHALGLEVWGDLQAGIAHADAWAHREALLEGYAMGAPPSRTNPEGQPWSYAVLDPTRPGAVRALLEARFAWLFAAYDGVRVDHPHALVCPWVYPLREGDQFAAVRSGGRLFSVGPRADLQALARLDIARPEQLRPELAPWADGFVAELEPAQVEAYARTMDALVAAGDPRRVACEVLSTVPYPLLRVIERHGLGRFRVTGKADVTRDDDVYRLDHARPPDWVMPGTHDTPPLWAFAAEWPDEVAAARARFAAARLAPDGVGRDVLEEHFTSSRPALAQGELAVLFTGPARNVQLWVSDVFGERGLYNRPGVVHPDNWTLRVPRHHRALHASRAARGEAFDPAAALLLALLSRPAPERRQHASLLRALQARVMAPLPGLGSRLEA